MRKGSLQRAEVRKVLAVLTLTTAAAAIAAVAVAVASPAAAAPLWRAAAADAPWMRADFVVERPPVADEGWDGANVGDGDGGDDDGGDGGWSEPGPGDGGDGGDGDDGGGWDGGDDGGWTEPDPGDGGDGGDGGGWDDGEVTILPAPIDDCEECLFYTTTDLEGQPVAAPGDGTLQPGAPRGAAAAAREGGADDACRPVPGRVLPAICLP